MGDISLLYVAIFVCGNIQNFVALYECFYKLRSRFICIEFSMKMKEFVIEDERLQLLLGESNLFAVCEPSLIETNKGVLFDGYPLVTGTQFSEVVSSDKEKVSALRLQTVGSNYFEVAGFIDNVQISEGQALNLILCKVLDDGNNDQLTSIAGGNSDKQAFICLGYFKDELSIVNLYSLNDNRQIKSSKDGIRIINANQDFEFKFDVDDEYQLSEPKF